MKKGSFYSMMMKNNKTNLVKHQGYLIQTDNNNFGIYKSEWGMYELIDLKTGLSVNHVSHKIYILQDEKDIAGVKLENTIG